MGQTAILKLLSDHSLRCSTMRITVLIATYETGTPKRRRYFAYKLLCLEGSKATAELAHLLDFWFASLLKSLQPGHQSGRSGMKRVKNLSW